MSAQLTQLLNALHPDLKARVIHHATKNFVASNAIMGRCISTGISLLWTNEQVAEKGERIVSAVKKALLMLSVKF